MNPLLLFPSNVDEISVFTGVKGELQNLLYIQKSKTINVVDVVISPIKGDATDLVFLCILEMPRLVRGVG